jgi:lipopolysaccharide biosynthesis glycosyltransferase
MNMQNIQYCIIFSADNLYVQHFCVALISLLENTSHKEQLKIYIIDGGITNFNKRLINSFFKSTYQITINFLYVNIETYSSFVISHHITHAAYYRFSIGNILPLNITKAIYLDCDILVKSDIVELFSLDLGGYILGAVDNPYFKRFKELNISEKDGYFNTGVLLINLELWRKSEISSQALAFMKESPEKIVLHDQDALNVIIKGRWLRLPPQWNQQSTFWDFYFQAFERKKLFNQKDFQEALENPSIIHYSSMCKPWDYDNLHPYRAEYYKYLALTPWANFQPLITRNKVIKRWVKKYIPKPIFETAKIIQKQFQKK